MRKLYTLILIILLSISLSYSQTKIGGTAKVGGKTNIGVAIVGGGIDFVTDTFIESGVSSTVTLGSHTGELGATWTFHPSYSASTFIDANTDRVYPAGDPQAYFASGVPPSTTQTVCVEINVLSDVSANIGPCARMDQTANTMYCARYNSGTAYDLRKIIAGTATTLATSTNQLISVGSFKTLCVVTNGTTISMTVNGTSEGSVTDADISSAGRTGFRAAGAVSSSTGYHLDNFHAQ